MEFDHPFFPLCVLRASVVNSAFRGLPLSNAELKRILFVEEQRRFGVDVGCAANRRDDLLALATVAADELAAKNAFLNPRLAFGQFAVGSQAGELGARAGAAGRTIVCLAGAKHEVAAVRRLIVRRAEQLDMVDFFAAGARDSF